jgi:hypothetical protein
MSDWEQELVDFINAKAKEHADMPMNKLGYFNLMAQLARHEVNHVEAKLRSQYWNHNQPTDYLINPLLAEEKDFCVECGVEVFDGGSWGYCDPCYGKLPKENEP